MTATAAHPRARPLASPRVEPLPAVPQTRVFGGALVVLALLLMTISPLALVSFGLSYEETGGSPLEKIHPATLLAAVLVAAAAASAGNPLTWALRRIDQSPALLPYLVVIVLLVLHATRVVHLPFTHFIDTFVLPVLILLLFRDMSPRRARLQSHIVHLVMLANAIVGLGEFATGLRLTPLVAAGVVIDDDWRSTALLGHPLANASLTGAYLLMLAFGGGRDLGPVPRLAAFAVNAGAMIAFGGRAASVMLLVMLAGLLLVRTVDILRGRRFRPLVIVKALSLAALAALGVTVLAEFGFFDQFLTRFVDDKGSADARTEMFELFRHIPLSELMLGPDARQIETLRFHYGLDFGIESFWIAFMLSHGIIASLAFFAALGYFTRDCLSNMRGGAIWAFVFFYAVASTSVSLSAKSPLLGIFTFMALVLMRHTHPAPASR